MKSSEKEDFFTEIDYDSDMKKFLYSLIGMLLLFGGFIVFLTSQEKITLQNPFVSSQPQTDQETHEESEIQQRQTIQKKDISLFNTAMEKRDRKQCNQISESRGQKECEEYLTVIDAQSQKDEKLCAQISTQSTLTLCQDTIGNGRAMEKKEKKYCNTIIEPLRQSYCEDTIDEINLREHIESLTLTESFCATLGKKYATVCLTQVHETNDQSYYQLALKKGSIPLCEKIKDKTLKNNCNNTLILNQVRTSKDVRLCSKITDTKMLGLCQSIKS